MGHSESTRILTVVLMAIVLNAAGGDGQVRGFGRCPKLTVSPLNPAANISTLTGGIWYVTHRTRSIFDFEMHCEKFFFTPKFGPNALTMDVIANTQFFKNIRIHGEMTTLDSNFQRWTANFRRTAISSLLLPNLSSTQFTILATDGASPPNVILLHSCSPNGAPEAVYVLSKTRFIDSTTLDQAQNLLMSAGLSSTLKEAEQTICF